MTNMNEAVCELVCLCLFVLSCKLCLICLLHYFVYCATVIIDVTGELHVAIGW